MGQRSAPAEQAFTPAVGLVSQAATNFFRYHRRRTTTAMERLTFCRVTPKTGPNRNSARLTPALDRGSLLCRLMDIVELRNQYRYTIDTIVSLRYSERTLISLDSRFPAESQSIHTY